MKKLQSLMEDEEIYEGGYTSRTTANHEDDERRRMPVRMLDVSHKMKKEPVESLFNSNFSDFYTSKR